jgi:DNA adenine methylase
MQPIIKWTGGKRREIKQFKEYYPDSFDTFVEPFFGGGATYFDLEHDGPAVIADAHEELINFYKVMKKGQGEQLYNMCVNPWHQLEKGRKKTDVGTLPEGFRVQDEKTYYYVRDYYQPKNALQEAFQFYFLRKSCYRGMLRYGTKGNFNIPYGRYKSINFADLKKPEYTEILQNTKIEKWSFEKVFKKYGPDKNAFFFLDPPYDSEFSNYKHAFGQREHKLLAEEFKKAKAKCMLVIGKSDLIDELYKGQIRAQYLKKYAFKLRDGRVGKEINNIHYIITNY